MGSYRQLTGMMEPPNRPDRVKPIPEKVEGENFPYRGDNDHGVAPSKGVNSEDYYEHDEWADGPAVIPVVKPEPEPEPVAVRIVQKTARERRDWRAGQFTVQDFGQQLLGRLDKRLTVRIVNNSSDTNVYIGHDSGVRPYTGFILEPKKDIPDLQTTEDIWVVCDATKSAVVSFEYEFGVEL